MESTLRSEISRTPVSSTPRSSQFIFRQIVTSFFVAVFAVLFLSMPASANEKWTQPPDLSTNGIDIRMDRSDGQPRLLADDFRCTTTGPITEVHFWGSWNRDVIGKLRRVHLSIHEDIPAIPGSHSRPGTLVWEKDFFAGEFSMSLYHQLTGNAFEWWMDPYDSTALNQFGDQQIWLVKVPIDASVAFIQQGSAADPLVYWLDISVEIEPDLVVHEFGWKTSDHH